MKNNGKRCSLGVIGITVALLGSPPALAKQSCQTVGCIDAVRQVASTADEGSESTPDARYRLRAGDVVELNAGQHVPADVRLVDGADADRFLADVKNLLQEFPEGAV